MKKEDIEKLPLIFEIFPDFPSIRVMQVTDQHVDVVQKFAEFFKENEYEFDVMASSLAFQNSLEDSLTNPSQYLVIKPLEYSNTHYNYKGRHYDTVVVDVDFSKIHDERYFFERIYAVMKNAAGMIVLIPKQSTILEGMIERLEDYNFVAVNPIDIFDEYQIIYAKKMHGWDGAR